MLRSIHISRGLIGYSEELAVVEDELLNGNWADNNDPAQRSLAEIAAVLAPLSDFPEQILGWVDAAAMRSGLEAQTRKDAMDFLTEYTSLECNMELLTPAPGKAPRYLLPTLIAIYENPKILKSAPLYGTFEDIMKKAVTLDVLDLVSKMRSYGATVNGKIEHPTP